MRIGQANSLVREIWIRPIDGQHIIIRASCPPDRLDITALERFPADDKVLVSSYPDYKNRRVLLYVGTQRNGRFDRHPAVGLMILDGEF